MRFVTVKELHEKTSSFLKSQEAVVVTLRGKPRALLQPITEDDLDGAWLQSREIRKRVLKGLEDIAAGRVLPHAEVKRRILG